MYILYFWTVTVSFHIPASAKSGPINRVTWARSRQATNEKKKKYIRLIGNIS